jgi:hypothetical protein
LGGVFLVNLGFGLAYLLIASRGANPADFLDTANVLVGNIFKGGGIISAAGLTNQQWSWDYFGKSMGLQASMFGMRLLELVILGVTIVAFIKALKNAIFQKIRIFFDLAMSAMTTALYFSPIDKLKETGNKLLYRLVVDAIFVPAYIAALIASTALAGQLGLAILESRAELGKAATEGTKAGVTADPVNIFQSMEVLAESTSTAGEIASAFENLAAVAIVGLFSAGLLYLVAKYFDEKYSEDINMALEMGKKGLGGLGSMAKWTARAGTPLRLIGKVPWVKKNFSERIDNWAEGKNADGTKMQGSGRRKAAFRMLGIGGQALGNVATLTHLEKMNAAGDTVKRLFTQTFQNLEKERETDTKQKADTLYTGMINALPGIGNLARFSNMPGTSREKTPQAAWEELRDGKTWDYAKVRAKKATDSIYNTGSDQTPDQIRDNLKLDNDELIKEKYINPDGTIVGTTEDERKDTINKFLQSGDYKLDSIRDQFINAIEKNDKSVLNMMMSNDFMRSYVQRLVEDEKLDKDIVGKIEENYQAFLDDKSLEGLLNANRGNKNFKANAMNFAHSKKFNELWDKVLSTDSDKKQQKESAEKYSNHILRQEAADAFAKKSYKENSAEFKAVTAGKPPSTDLTYRQALHIENNTWNDINTDPLNPGTVTANMGTNEATLNGNDYDLTDLTGIKNFMAAIEADHLNTTQLREIAGSNPILQEVIKSVVDIDNVDNVTNQAEKKQLETRMKDAVLNVARTRKSQVKGKNIIKPEEYLLEKLKSLTVGTAATDIDKHVYALVNNKSDIQDFMKKNMAENGVADNKLDEYSSEAINQIIATIKNGTPIAPLIAKLNTDYKITDPSFGMLADTSGASPITNRDLNNAMTSYKTSATSDLEYMTNIRWVTGPGGTLIPTTVGDDQNAKNQLNSKIRQIQTMITNAEKNATKVSAGEW